MAELRPTVDWDEAIGSVFTINDDAASSGDPNFDDDGDECGVDGPFDWGDQSDGDIEEGDGDLEEGDLFHVGGDDLGGVGADPADSEDPETGAASDDAADLTLQLAHVDDDVHWAGGDDAHDVDRDPAKDALAFEVYYPIVYGMHVVLGPDTDFERLVSVMLSPRLLRPIKVETRKVSDPKRDDFVRIIANANVQKQVQTILELALGWPNAWCEVWKELMENRRKRYRAARAFEGRIRSKIKQGAMTHAAGFELIRSMNKRKWLFFQRG